MLMVSLKRTWRRIYPDDGDDVTFVTSTSIDNRFSSKKKRSSSYILFTNLDKIDECMWLLLIFFKQETILLFEDRQNFRA